ncbi:hypothetical protein [Nonomuraea turkmeniaca]|uniref:hypothetical protein n=1 Tax=Nonomuraea turkmeniaca TaxID=103838 RepID=UPI001B866307|nr:hypothetical protein [Nonomuraea turkmeniaca]
MLVSPELADVLSAIIRRVRGLSGAIPLAPFYDVREKVWNPPMPLLFQRQIGAEHRAFTPTFLRTLLIGAIAGTGLTDAGGAPLTSSPHDIEGFQVSLAGAEEKLRQLDRGHGQHTAVDLGIPTTRGDR